MVQLSTTWQMLNSTRVSYSSTFTGDFQLWARIIGSQDVANNRTKVEYQWYMVLEYGWISSDNAQDYVTGAGWNEATRRNYDATMALRSWEGWISHNSDGTGSGTCWGRTLMEAMGVDTGWVQGDFTLPTIPRASKPTASPNPCVLWQGGQTLTVNTNRKSSAFKHTISVQCGSWSWTSTARSVDTSVSVPIPYTVGAQIPSTSKTATATVTCTTYNGTTQIGSAQTCSVTIQINATQDHTNIGTITVQDINSRTSSIVGAETFIYGISTLQATIPLTVSGDYTELASAVVTCGNRSQTYTLSDTSQTITFTFDKVDYDSLTVKATDKRGNSVSKTKSYTLMAYQPETVTGTVGRVTATGSTAVGQVSGVAYGGNYGQASNELTVTYKYKEHDSSTWTDSTYSATLSLNEGQQTYTHAITLLEEYDYQKQYDIQFVVNDLFNTATYTAQLMQGLPILSWDETEVDVWGDLHIHSRENPYVWQDVMQGFDAILAHGGQKNFYSPFATQTVSGVTGTLNADLSYRVVGTATTNAWLGYGTTHLSAGDYILSGGKDGVNVMLRDSNGNYVGESIDGEEFAFTVSSDSDYRCYLSVPNGATVDTTVYPMIRDARIASDEYVRGGQILTINRYTSGSISVPANNTANTVVNFSLPKGYKVLAILRTWTNGNILTNYSTTESHSSTTSARVYLRNPTSSAISVTVTVEVLCMREDFFI